MKPHLSFLVLGPMVLVPALTTVQAAVRHTDVSTMTYVDFATNSGRYTTGTTNALLDYIRQRDGGVRIEYTRGQCGYVLPHGVPSFDSVADMGNMTAIGYNYVATVAHNASQLYPTFSRNDYGVGADKAIRYVTIDEYGSHNTFVHHIFSGQNDYKVARLSKLVTDVIPAQLAGGSGKDYKGSLVYRVGGGLQQLRDAKGNSDESIQDVYLVGGIAGLTSWSASTSDLRHGFVTGCTSWERGMGAGEGTPLPFGSTEGDSGSPYFVWEGSAESGSHKFLMAHRGSMHENRQTQGCEALEWTQRVMQEDSFCIDMGKVKGTLLIQGARMPKAEDGKKGLSDVINGVTVTASIAHGFLTDAQGNVYDTRGNSYFRALESGVYAWKPLSALKNNDVWYAYGHEYLNAAPSVRVEGKNVVAETGLTYAALFQTQNLVFEAAAPQARYAIKVTEDTDLGAGYLRFASQGNQNVRFDLSSAGKCQLLSAGYVVDAGVQVDVYLRQTDASYMREWRKVGAGTLNICGSGNNEVYLNLGGGGYTLLNQRNGYAAYNVLVNSGAAVRIADPEQIFRDLTFGNGGGFLDLNGQTMDWYLTGGESREGFTIQALTEEAVIGNSSPTKAILRFKEGGKQSFVGSFRDSSKAALGIVYAGGGTWELNGIQTQLQHADSGLTVENGTVCLSGTPTVHGYGTTHTRETADFTTRENDWHYADATMNVTVRKGACFELKSHTRLVGNVTVEKGGCYIMHPGVHAEREYIEGGEQLENTADIAEFYGHKGAVKLAAGATLQLQPGTHAELQQLELRKGSRIETAGATLAVEQISLVLESPHPGQLSRGKFQGVKEIRHPKGKFMMLKPGHSMLVVNASLASDTLELNCRKLVVDFHLKLKKPIRGLVQVRLGEKLRFLNPREMRIEANYARRTLRGFYIPETPDSVYFYM